MIAKRIWEAGALFVAWRVIGSDVCDRDLIGQYIVLYHSKVEKRKE